jgi:hypothetical protein
LIGLLSLFLFLFFFVCVGRGVLYRRRRRQRGATLVITNTPQHMKIQTTNAIILLPIKPVLSTVARIKDMQRQGDVNPTALVASSSSSSSSNGSGGAVAAVAAPAPGKDKLGLLISAWIDLQVF